MNFVLAWLMSLLGGAVALAYLARSIHRAEQRQLWAASVGGVLAVTLACGLTLSIILGYVLDGTTSAIIAAGAIVAAALGLLVLSSFGEPFLRLVSRKFVYVGDDAVRGMQIALRSIALCSLATALAVAAIALR